MVETIKKEDIIKLLKKLPSEKQASLRSRAPRAEEPSEERETPKDDSSNDLSFKVEKGCIYRAVVVKERRSWEKLTNYNIRVLKKIKTDNGQAIGGCLLLELLCNGRSYGERLIPNKIFDSKNFVLEWGTDPSTKVGPYKVDYVRSYVRQQGLNVEERTIFGHIGFRKISDKAGSKLVFLHSKGAVGSADDISVDLEEGQLNRYFFPLPGESPFDIGIVGSLFELAPHNIIYPLIGFVFLTPLNEFFRQKGIEPAFVLYLAGTSGCGKSTMAALMLSFFGNFDSKSLPASFKDTVNSLEKKAFLVKDALFVVDDYHPVGNRQEALKMQALAQAIVRSFGDRTGRSRLDRDVNLRKAYVPRGNCIMTGEDIPEISKSGRARCLFVEMRNADIDFGVLAALEREKGKLSAFMRAYIEWLIPQADKLPEYLRDRFESLRKETSSEFHGRTNDSCAHLQIGFEMFLKFLAEKGYDEASLGEMGEELRVVLETLKKEQSKPLQDDDPTTMFFAALRELYATGAVKILELDGNKSVVSNILNNAPTIGYKRVYAENEFPQDLLYLHPETTFAQVVQFYDKQGRLFPATKSRLYTEMANKKQIIFDSKKDRHTVLKKIDGKTSRYLNMYASYLEAET